ncbi:putative ring finger [Lyophyllum shimeji]|uniref:Ring finger n=1 Tax=Lyophyllum shimeji TaxID=47721 RepID=A0A9P3PMS6_LYOSH|nr:putative ring finger [Lyophyllum shimeji]
MARSSSYKSQPVTPQRLPSQRPHHRHSSSQSFYKSPVTPASPYTPLSLRSFTSSGSGGSSTLTTPDHNGLSVKRLSFSPDVVRPATEAMSKDHSLADIAKNWRSRASENGIKVSSLNEDPHFGDDEASERALSDTADQSGFIPIEEALLTPSLIANQRRPALPRTTRPRAQSHVPPPTSRAFSSPIYIRSSTRTLAPPSSPLVTRRLNQSQNANVTSTPPPNRALAKQLKLKGSFTDPAHTRRREAFGPLHTPAQNMNKSFTLRLHQDTSFDLFDIDENDFENEHPYNDDLEDANDSLMELSFHSKNNISTNSVNSYGYPSYTVPLLPSYAQSQQFFPSQQQARFSDPFEANALASITESVEHYFHTQQFADGNVHPLGQGKYPRHPSRGSATGPAPAHTRASADGYAGRPAWVPVPAPSTVTPPKFPEPAKPAERKAPVQSGCSVCLAPHPRTLALLIPCNHPLCSGCLTSALNIVGEKDMECAVCRYKVADFKLVTGEAHTAPAFKAESDDDGKTKHQQKSARPCDVTTPDGQVGKSFMEPLFSSPGSGITGDGQASINGLESAFEFGLGLDSVRASTPKREEWDRNAIEGENDKKLRERGRGKEKGEENVVLRIDNVPWDITPPQIQRWLQQPLERVHVLLDKRGKTLSHAYVEVADVAVAGKILRGEAQGGGRDGKPRERGSVLGKGRRARGVTVTRSGQEELMADLFPNWRGSFDGSRPSLAGLGSERVIGALEGGLIGESEVVGLLHLIKEPDSHFLKAPSLPFHSLISILSKFPADVDSRVFWSAGVRDMLYDVTYAAVQILLSRVKADPKHASDKEYSMELVSNLVKTALGCHAFTAQQLNKFTEFLETCTPRVPSPKLGSGSGSGSSIRSEPRTPENRDLYGRVSDVSTATVEGEAQRLSPRPGGEGEDGEALAELAREFGVEAQLVQALAQRLAGLS